MKFNEDLRVKIPTILYLMRLGYQYLSLKDPKLIWDESTNIFNDIFQKSIKRINPSFTEHEAKQYFDSEITVVNIQKFQDDPNVTKNTDYNLNIQRMSNTKVTIKGMIKL